MAKLAATSLILPHSPNTTGFLEQMREQGAELDKLVATSRALPPGQVVGAVLKWQRADGYAMYLVTNERPLTIQHIDFADAWTIEPALIRGLNKNDVLDMIDRDQRFAAIFSGKKGTP